MPRTDERNLTGNCPEVHPLDSSLSGVHPLDSYLSGEHTLDSYLSGERPLDSYLSQEHPLDSYLPGYRLASPLSGEILLELYLYAYATCLLPFELEFTDVLL